MTTLQAADGRILRARRPAGLGFGLTGGFFPNKFPPMWSDGTRYGDEDGRYLKSYDAIYRSQPVVAAVVNKLARRIAALPLDVLRSQPDGSRETIRGNTLDTLMRRPRPRSSNVHLLGAISTSLLVHGNSVCAKLRTGEDREAPPDMLWPLDWAHVNAYGAPGGTIEWWSTTQFGDERFIRAEDTVHFAWPGPDGGELGVSPLEHLGVTVRLEDAAQREQTSIFRNGIRPSAGVSVDLPNPSREQLEMAGAIVKAAHGGMDRSGGWVWMGANTKITPLSFTPVEAALIEQRQRSWEEIAAVYDMAGPLSGDLKHGTYSNVQVILDSLYRDVVPPWTTLIVETLQAQLIDPEPAWLDLHVRFDFSDKLRGDPVAAAQADKLLVESGIETTDEIRTRRGRPPFGGAAAEPRVNVNNQGLLQSMDRSDSTSASPAVNGR